MMGGAAAQVVFHSRADLAPGGLRGLQQEGEGIHDHSGRAEAALQPPGIGERLLEGMELAVLLQTLDRRDVLPAYGLHRHLARTHRLLAYDHGAGSAEALAAPELRSREAEVGAQHPQKRSIAIDIQMDGPVSYTHLRAHETRHDLVC